MAKNRIDVDVVVDDNGTLKQTAAGARKASAGLDQTAKSAHTADRNLKGAAQASSNSTKNFSKMAQGTGGLVAAYATLAANIFAISAAYNFLKSAGDVAALTRGQQEYALKTGKSMTLLTSRLQEATGGMLAFEEASQAAAIGVAAGLTNEQLTGLARVAKNASVSLGRDLTDSFNRLTRGAIKAEPELLDELGIIIRLDKATSDYGMKINKAAKDLTQFEKSQAVVNAVLEQGFEKFDDVGDNVNQIARLGKEFRDLVKEVKDAIEPVATFLGESLADNVKGLAAAFGVLGLSIVRSLAPATRSFAQLDDMALGAKNYFQDVAMTGPKAGKMAANIREGNIGTQEMSAIGFATGAKNSTVLDVSKANVQETQRNLAIMRAHHKMSLAKKAGFWKGWRLKLKAELAMLEIDHGKTMAKLKLAQMKFVQATGAMLNAVAMLGMLYTAVTLIQSLIDKLRDPAIRALEDRAEAIRDRFKEQNQEVSFLLKNMKDTNSQAGTLLQQAKLLSNLEFGGAEGMAASLERATFKKSGPSAKKASADFDPTGANEEVIEGMGAVLKTLNIQQDAFEKFGLTSKQADEQKKRLAELQSAYEIVAQGADFKLSAEQIEDANKRLGNGFNKNKERVRLYNLALEALRGGFDGAVTSGRDMNTVLSAQEKAILSITQTAEEVDKYQQSLGQTNSKFTQMFSLARRQIDVLNTLDFGDKGSMVEYFGADQEGIGRIAAFGDLLGKTADEIKDLSKQEVINLFDEKILAGKKMEYDIMLRQVNAQKMLLQLTRNKSPLQVAEVQRQFAIKTAQDAVIKQVQDINQVLTDGSNIDATKLASMNAQLDILREQLAIAKEKADFDNQLLDAGRSGMEGAATKSFADLIKGDESSFSDAFKNIAKGAVDAVANTLAQKASKVFTDFVFGPSETATLEAATKDNTVKLEQLTQTIETLETKLREEGKISESPLDPSSAEGIAGTDSKEQKKGFLEEARDKIKKETKEMFSGLKDTGKDLFAKMKNGLKGFMDDLPDFFGDLGGMLKDGLGGLGGILKDLFGGFRSMLGFRYGGITPKRGPGFSEGGIASGSTSGYPAILHGTEAVVPLPNNKKIPVEMKGGGEQTNNITVNVASDGGITTQGNDGGVDQEKLGRAIAASVRQELQNQKRSGGMLNPYGAS